MAFRPNTSALILLACVLGLISPARMTAQEIQHKSAEVEESSSKNAFKFGHLLQDQAAIWTAPCRLKTKDLCFWGPAVAGTALIILHDEKIYREIKGYQDRHDWVDWLSPRVTKLGDGDIHLGIVTSLFLGGLIFKDDKLRETGGLCLQTLFHTAVVVNMLKHAFGRQRPDYGNGKDGWHGLSDSIARYTTKPQSRYNAFPSGHTIIVWGSAAVIARRYPKPLVVPIACYSLATMVGLSRITENRHWLGDVVFGAVLGHAIGTYIVNKRSSKLTVQPAATSVQVSLTLGYEF